MIPARLGSQRLKRKNLCLCGGLPLIARAIRKCKAAGVFDEIWVNTESDEIGNLAIDEGVGYHKRPAKLSANNATSEQFVYEFLKQHQCAHLIQVHSIAPLLGARTVREFAESFVKSDYDVLLAAIERQIECMLEGKPINFTFDRKTNSQELSPVQVITWSITGWRAASYVAGYEQGRTATYYGKVGVFPVSAVSGHVIKTAQDLRMAEQLLGLAA